MLSFGIQYSMRDLANFVTSINVREVQTINKS